METGRIAHVTGHPITTTMLRQARRESSMSPQFAAQLDWSQTGEFRPEQFEGDQRKEYEAEAAKIERQWDNQPQ